MSKKLANSTTNLLLGEIAKDLADPSMGDVTAYWNTMSSKIEEFLESHINCTHSEYTTSTKVIGLSSSGKKRLASVRECKNCGKITLTNL